MILYILRGAFLVLAASVTALYLISYQKDQGIAFSAFAIMMSITIGAALAVIAIDAFTRQKKLAALSGVFLGLIGGMLAAYALSFVIDLVGILFSPTDPVENQAFLDLLQGVKVFIGLVTCYIGISMVMQTKDDFRFVIPYVEFAREVRGNRPTLLDTSVIIDGRILDIVQTQIIQGSLIVPKFVLNELQTVADSSDKLRRVRGRRGLEILQKLQENSIVQVNIDEADDREIEGTNVDQKLVHMAQLLNARIMTNDYNLSKIANLRGVDVINLNDLAKALRPVVLPGETMIVKIVRPGEGPGQGVGYLEDGTMVVVEEARSRLNQEIELVVTSTLQTSAGRMIFGRYEGHDASPVNAAATATTNDDPNNSAPGSRPVNRPMGGRNPRRQ